jgi:hypothetical protein
MSEKKKRIIHSFGLIFGSGIQTLFPGSEFKLPVENFRPHFIPAKSLVYNVFPS